MAFRIRHIIISSIGLIIFTIIIVGSGSFVDKIKKNEEARVRVLARALEELAVSKNFGKDASLLLSIIENNNSIPVIVVNSLGAIEDFKNIDYSEIRTPRLLKKQLDIMEKYYPPIPIFLGRKKVPDQYVYYSNSTLLNDLKYYPFIIIFMISILVFFIYYILLTTKKSEENKIWVSIAKETAHQIGTPLSAISGWLEILKTNPSRNIEELPKIKEDLTRLNIITDRFSKIGSKPMFKRHNIVKLIQNNINYLQKRLSNRINIIFHHPKQEEYVKLNKLLFEWVLENMIKNSVDSMRGEGTITIEIESTEEKTKIYIKDTGRGIPITHFTKIFDTGFTTKKRGWGMGLSLVKRVIKDYHKARVYVVKSTPNEETIFAINFLKKRRDRKQIILSIARKFLKSIKFKNTK